ncbi:MAG: site-specific DNA-methyltransferase [Bacteroidota bacterium]
MSTERLDLSSPDFVNENYEKLAALFPNCVTETTFGKAIDFDLLKQELSHSVVDGTKERYRLEWPGKREAIVTANLPTTKTLRPVRDDSVDFDNTENLYIEGDNLEVLKLLQESYLSKIKMIYIDPPYNTGKDFVYKDNFAQDVDEYVSESGQKDEYNRRLVVNPETAGRYHSDWLTMMYPRLKLARNLLTDDGVIFISIDDNEVHNLIKICDEIFGEGNFIGLFCRKTKSGGGSASDTAAIEHDYVLAFARNNLYAAALTEIFSEKYLSRYKETDDIGPYFWDTMERSSTKTIPYKITAPDGQILTGKWFRSEQTFLDDLAQGEVRFLKKEDGWSVQFKQRLADGKKLRTILEDSNLTDKKFRSLNQELEDILGFSIGHPPKPVELMSTLIYSTCNKNSSEIILDFFSGSASTAHATIDLNTKDQLNRKFIMVQLPEDIPENSDAKKAGYKNICEIGKERIRKAGKKIRNEQFSMLNNKKEELDKLTKGQLSLEINTKVKELNLEIEYLQVTLDHLDIGFRVYRLADSNMQDVFYKPQDYKQEIMDLFSDNVRPDRTPDDLLAQVMLDWGLPLSLKIEHASISGKHVFKVANNSLYACYDKGIDEEFAKAISVDKPLRIVFRDSGFKDDTAKTNIRQLLKQLSPETEMKVF